MLQVSHIVNKLFNSRTYILSNDASKEVWLVDCGDVEKLPSDIIVKGVLLTHAHFDHIYGLPKLLERFPDCVICGNEFTLKALADSKINMSKYHGEPISLIPQNTIVCKEGDSIKILEDYEVIIYETPGHNAGCVTYEIGKYIFTGDAYIPGEKVVTVLPHANKREAAVSLQRILNLSQEKIVCPGHEILK